MNLIPLSNTVYGIMIVVGALVAFVAFILLLSYESYQKRAITGTAVVLVVGAVFGITFAVLFGLQHAQAIATVKSEVQRVYHIALVDEQATDLLNHESVPLNDGGRVELKQNPNGTYKLVQPVSPRDYPVGGNLAQG